MTTARTANPAAGTDSITLQDDRGQVQYVNSAAQTVFLQAGIQAIGLDIIATGAGTITLQAVSGAYLNGTANGSMTLTANTPYRLFTTGSNGKNPAQWFCK